MTVASVLALLAFVGPVVALFTIAETGLVASLGGWGRLGGGMEVSSARTTRRGQRVTFWRPDR